MLSGLFDLSNAHEWIVTQKLGNWAVTKAKNAAAAVAAVVPVPAMPLVRRKVYRTELLMSGLFAVAAFFAIFVHANWQYSIFLVLQGTVFFAFGLSLCGALPQPHLHCIPPAHTTQWTATGARRAASEGGWRGTSEAASCSSVLV